MFSNRIVIFLTVTLTLLGLGTFFIMPREEDPKIKERNAITVVTYPGASPEKIERLVVRPLEDELLKVQDLKLVEVEIRLNVAIFQLELLDSTPDLDKSWQEVERAIARAQPKLPPTVPPPVLDFTVIEVESIVLAVTGSDDLVALVDTAQRLRDQLRKNPQVSEVRIFGSPGLEVQVAVNTKKMHQQGVSIPQLLTGIAQNNSAAETGYIIQNSRNLPLEQDNDQSTIQAIGDLRFDTGRLVSTRLSDIADIKRTTALPPQTLFRWNGRPAVGLGLVPKDKINVVQFGDAFLSQLSNLKEQIKPLDLEIVAFQPQRTKDRINDLLMSLLTGMLLIGAFLAIFVGRGMALVVSISVPMITLIGLFLYYLTGGVLQQISIAAFVISIGQFIDNIIVIVESTQRKMRQGLKVATAATLTAQELRRPMLFATLTGICAFMPMLSAQGGTADFTFSLPLVAVITLIASYLVAIEFAPLLTAKLLKGSDRPLLQLPLTAIENLFANLATGPLKIVAGLVAGLAIVSLVSLFLIDKEFFPESDRNEFLFTIELPASSDIESTNQILKEVEGLLAKDPRVTSRAAFAGGETPRFYYNLPQARRSPQAGQVLVTVTESALVKTVGQELETKLRQRHPTYEFTAQFLQQGPPINAKIEVNFFTPHRERQTQFVNEMSGYLKADPRVRSVRIDETAGLSTLKMKAKDQVLSDLSLKREDLNGALAFLSSGARVSQFRFDRELLPVVVRDEKGLQRSQEDLQNQLVLRGRARDFKVLDLVATETQDLQPLLRRENGQPFVRVLGDLNPGQTFSQVMKDLKPVVDRQHLGPDEFITFGGDAKGAGEANAQIFQVVPLAMTLLILFLLAEFKSFRKVLIATLALPITILGVFPGLLLGGAAFGFMSLLGLLVLIGITINNIILLLEAMDSQDAENKDSVRSAIAERFRAIFLTTVLTILGLLPLALQDSSLWPPLAWTMISGLVTSTIATLIVVPCLHRLFFRSQAQSQPQQRTVTAPVLVGAFLTALGLSLSPTDPALAETLSLQQLGQYIEKTHQAQTLTQREQSAQAQLSAQRRDALAPTISLGGEAFQRSQELAVATPFGNLRQEEQDRIEAQVQIRQPLFSAAKMVYQTTAKSKDVAAVISQNQFDLQLLRYRFIGQAIETLILKEELKFTDASMKNLNSRRSDIIKLVNRGRLSQSDLLKIDINLEKLQYQQRTLEDRLKTLNADLARQLNITLAFQLTPPPKVQHIGRFQFNTSLSEIDALELRTQALEAQLSTIKASTAPNFNLFARGILTEGRNLVNEQWTEVGVQVSWDLFSGGVRSAERRQLAAEKAQTQHQLAVRRHDRLTEFNDSQSQAQSDLQWLKDLDGLSKKSRTNRRIEEQRYFEGRGNLSDLVEADSLSLEIERDIEVINLRLLMHCMKLRLLSGQTVDAFCGENG